MLITLITPPKYIPTITLGGNGMNKYAIGKRIEACRIKLHMSTKELAAKINRSQASISRIENGKQGLSFELLQEIAEALQVHPFTLLSDPPPTVTPHKPAGALPGLRFSPNLLANALRGGRLRRNLSLETVARLLEVSVGELEAQEIGLACPAEAYLERMCELYGLDSAEIRSIKYFGEAVPEFARSLAYLQHLFAQVRHILRQYTAGDDANILQKIRPLFDSADTYRPLPPYTGNDEAGQLLNRLSLHLLNVIKDMDPSAAMQLAKAKRPNGDRPPK